MNPTVDPTKMCVSKKVSYIGLFVLVVVGYVIFSFVTLQNKKNTQSRAAGMTTHPVDVELYGHTPLSSQDVVSNLLPEYWKNDNRSLKIGIPQNMVSTVKQYIDGAQQNEGFAVFAKQPDGSLRFVIGIDPQSLRDAIAQTMPKIVITGVPQSPVKPGETYELLKVALTHQVQNRY